MNKPSVKKSPNLAAFAPRMSRGSTAGAGATHGTIVGAIGEAGEGEARTPVVDRIDAASKVAQADVANPVPAVQANRRVQMVGVVVAEPDFVDETWRDHPGVAGGG